MLIRRSLALLLLLALPLAAQDAELDRIASQAFASDAPGGAVLVLKGGKTLLRAGYGMADLEQGTKITPDSVFRIGSITKQFTAVAVLQLVERGKIALGDPITKFLPDYPTHGKTITIEHLLTHTSGIQSYTDKPDFLTAAQREYTPAQIIDTFRNDPMKFDPGAQWAYNNSGYILLGQIIEKVSGMPYAEYVQKNVLARAGLTHSRYGDNAPIVPKRVPGYSRNGQAVVNARYINMTFPYAAGALLSTVDDLAQWNAALAAGKVVDRKLLDRAWTRYQLTSGENTGYGYGWAVGELSGERVIQHGGGIFGYTSFELWMPDRDLYTAILSNSDSPEMDPGYVAGLLALQAIGKPWVTSTIAMSADELAAYTGVYRVDANTTRTLTLEDGRLYSQRSGGPRAAITPVAKDTFGFSNSFTRMTFERDAAGRVAAMIVDDGRTKTRAARTDEKPATRTVIEIEPAKLDRYTGRYELRPGFILTILRRGDELWSVATGQPEFRIYPESETSWFLKAFDAQLTFEFDENGVANGLTLHQGGRNIPAPKIK